MILDLNSKYNQSVPAFKSGSNVVIEVLPWLVNQPWNALALAYVTALRPYLTVFDVKSMGYRTLNLATAPAGFNEAMSAGLAKMLPADLRGSVRSAIMATANHTRHQTVPDDVEIFLDLDLLGFADPSCLTTAEDALRREYPTISDEQFAEKRCAFLRVMLERAIYTGLYYRPIHKARALNALAIQNIQALLGRYNAG